MACTKRLSGEFLIGQGLVFLAGSSDSDRGSSSSTEEEEEEEEEKESGWGSLADAPTPLTEFRALKQEAAAKLCLAEKESPVRTVRIIHKSYPSMEKRSLLSCRACKRVPGWIPSLSS